MIELARRRIFLAAGINTTGWSPRSWAAPGTRWDRFNRFEHYLEATRSAHAGVFDAVFLSDHQALARNGASRPNHTFDPTVLFSALAASVPDIGFFLTASSTYNAPYNLARRLATLDEISGGRVIWNVVSSFNPDQAANFGTAPLPPRAQRYRRADEAISVVKQLWLSWDRPGPPPGPDGPLWEAASARRIDHHGEFFDVSGPLNVPIGPQGHPVIAQAGASDAGMELAAKHADLVYGSLLSQPAALDYGADIRRRAAAYGRDPSRIRIMPGLVVVLGDTREQALARHEQLNGDRREVQLIADLARRYGLGERTFDPAEPLDPQMFAYDQDQAGPVGHRKAMFELAAQEEITWGQVVRRIDGHHRLALGTAREVADHILDWWSSGAVDGFVIQPAVLPDDLVRFSAEVVPLLQSAGAFPGRYEHATVRERFDLPDPVAAKLTMR